MVERTVVETAPAPDESSAAPAPQPEQEAEPEREPEDRGGELPDLVGERLDVAESELDDLGIEFEEVGGGTFGIVDTSNWEVCETRPTAGQRVSSGDAVKLIVDRPDAC